MLKVYRLLAELESDIVRTQVSLDELAEADGPGWDEHGVKIQEGVDQCYKALRDWVRQKEREAGA